MDSDELKELLFLEDYLNRILRRLQRRLLASGGKIEDDGNLCRGMSQAEASREIEEEVEQSSDDAAWMVRKWSQQKAGARNEIDWLEQNFGMERLDDNLGIASRRYLQRLEDEKKNRRKDHDGDA